EPKVTREQALAIAEQRFGQNVRTRWAQLSVGWRHDDRAQGQVLRWEVVLQSDPLNPELPDMPLRGSYTIDAQTGEVLEELR
nr:PepSY domain-containing protein [Anaerolineae bacterium]